MKLRQKPTKRPPVIRVYTDENRLGVDEIIADNFAGGGGASTGIEVALGRSPTMAINHDAEALAMHEANHPTTRHMIENVWNVDPILACGGSRDGREPPRRVGLAWFSPDCKHHSKAKGGKPRDAQIRGLAWVAVRWAAAVRPRVIALENVEEFVQWGPLHKQHTDGCAGRGACRKTCRINRPIESRRAETFRAFVRRLEKLGYVVEHRMLKAHDYGAPTSRRRLFLIARCDGRAIRWPEPTHGPGRALPHRTAAEIIDWDIAAPSIFGRAKPLADKTLARLGRGFREFVVNACAEGGRPYIVPTAHGGVGRRDHRVHSIDEPVRTVCGSRRGDHALAVPYLIHRSNGERPGQAPRIYDVRKPLGVVVAQGLKHAPCIAWLVKHYGGNESTRGGTDLRASIDTVTAQDHHSLAAVWLMKYYGTSTGSSLHDATPTVTSGGGRGGVKLAQVVAFLERYVGSVELLDGLPIVRIAGEIYVVVDIGMRMLTPRELFRAQGFSDAYRIDPIGPKGKPLTKTAQIRMVGNSVCPPLASAIVRAQFEPGAPVIAW